MHEWVCLKDHLHSKCALQMRTITARQILMASFRDPLWSPASSVMENEMCMWFKFIMSNPELGRRFLLSQSDTKCCIPLLHCSFQSAICRCNVTCKARRTHSIVYAQYKCEKYFCSKSVAPIKCGLQTPKLKCEQ